MIEAKDLRFGNLITDGTHQILRVNTVYQKYVTVDGRVSCHYSDQIRGIELTPEILVAAGFSSEGMSVGSEWWNKLVGIRTDYNGVCCFELSLFTTQHEDFGINLEEQYFGYCKYLHELQNKYHAITGEELKIELPTTGKE